MEIPPVDYDEPAWAAPPTSEFYFEIIREGKVLGTSSPIQSSKLVAGRLPNCDLVLEHQSSSRFHAIIQFKENESFLYDLGSTHGTFLNKSRIEAKKYLPLKVGDMIKFGASSRIFIFSGPESEEELHARNAVPIPTQQKQKIKPKEEDLQVAWGFKDDAYEGDEWNGVDVKSAVDRAQIPTDAYYQEDPKKALQLFIDNNGCELQTSYKTEKKSIECQLSITGLEGPISATGTGKKKPGAEKDACLEMCYKLEKLGILKMKRGSLAERNKRMRKEFEDDDEFMNYLDKTGYWLSLHVDRQKKTKSTESEQVETFATLTLKRNEKLKLIHEYEQQIANKDKKEDAKEEDEEDALEAYMAVIKNTVKKDEEKKAKTLLTETKNELAEIEKMMKLADPKGFEKLKTEPTPDTTFSGANSNPKPAVSVSRADPKPIVASTSNAKQSTSNRPLFKDMEFSKAKAPVELKATRPIQGPSKKELERQQSMMENDEDFVDLPMNEQTGINLNSASQKYGY